jgi:hypothetical protein|tara:strand:+ start:823 stop:1014 length:192 start_codon:yes stop_codon:yes gene_type:complete
MGKYKNIETNIDEIIRLTYLLGDFSTHKEFTEIVYAKCLDQNIPSANINYADKRIGEVLGDLI